jgi:adenylate kinase family enzyme
MNRVVVLGRGGAGKSTLAVRLGEVLSLPVVELDKHFWSAGLSPTPKEEWEVVQRRLVDAPRWVLDGDLGPHDVLHVRLRAADTVVVLDFPLWRCAWRALRRSRENPAFWRWVLTYRRHALPLVMDAIAEHAGAAELHVLKNPGGVERFLARANGATPRP